MARTVQSILGETVLSLAIQDLDERGFRPEGEWAASETGISYLQLATLRLSGRFSSSTIPGPVVRLTKLD